MGELKTRDILAVAASFGLATGLLEGISRSALQSLGGMSFDMLLTGTSIKIIWVAPIFYVLLFSLGGALLAILAWVVPPLPMKQIAVFVFALVGSATILSSSGRIISWGVGILALGVATALARWFKAQEQFGSRFCRRSLLWLTAGTVLAFAGIETGIRLKERAELAALPPATPGAPNVLVIVMDTMRKDHLSCYGYARKTSPNLERIATQSVQFQSAIATSSWTLPSHASMLTGLYPSAHGAETFPLKDRNLVLPEALLARGYRTAAFSANTILFDRAHGFGRGFIRFEDSFHNFADMVSRTLLGRQIYKRAGRALGFDDIPGRKKAAEVNREVLRWLNQDPERPFFAFLNYFDLHDPYLPPQPYRGKFSKHPNPGGVFNSFIGRNDWRLFTPDVLEDEMAAYDGSAAYIDDMIGQLIGELERRGLDGNTILVITSDHGESFGEHGLYGHQTSLYREQIEVPLIIRWLGKIPAGRKVSVPVSLADLPATIMELIGEPRQAPFPGRSLVETWTDSGLLEERSYPAAELAATPNVANPKNPAKYGFLKALVSPRWYLVVYEKRETELFDRENDPQQLHNLARTPDGTILVNKLKEDLHRSLPHGFQGEPEIAHGNAN